MSKVKQAAHCGAPPVLLYPDEIHVLAQADSRIRYCVRITHPEASVDNRVHRVVLIHAQCVGLCKIIK